MRGSGILRVPTGVLNSALQSPNGLDYLTSLAWVWGYDGRATRDCLVKRLRRRSRRAHYRQLKGYR